MKNFIVTGLVFGITAIHFAKADGPWGNVSLQANDGTLIAMTYQTPSGQGSSVQRAFVYFNINTSRGSNCAATVRVMVTTTCGDWVSNVQPFDLVAPSSPMGCRFTNEKIANLVAVTFHDGVCSQQLSAVVDGKWLSVIGQDGNHNFAFTLPEVTN